MTLIVRFVELPVPMDLGAAGVCRVGLADVVGAWGSSPVVRVVFLNQYCGVAA